MEVELKAAGAPWWRANVWANWFNRLASKLFTFCLRLFTFSDAIPQFYFKAKMTKALWELYEKYPCGSDIYTARNEKDLTTWTPNFPQLIRSQMNHFLVTIRHSIRSFSYSFRLFVQNKSSPF